MSRADLDAEKWMQANAKWQERERMSYKLLGTFNEWHHDWGKPKEVAPVKMLHRVTVEVPAIYEILVEATSEEEATKLALQKPLADFDSCGEPGGEWHHLYTEKAA